MFTIEGATTGPARDFRPVEPMAACDARLEARARALLEQHPHFHGRSQFIRCHCHDSELHLEGCVPCFYLKQLAQEAVRSIDGVTRVDNQIVVAPPDGHSAHQDACEGHVAENG